MFFRCTRHVLPNTWGMVPRDNPFEQSTSGQIPRIRQDTKPKSGSNRAKHGNAKWVRKTLNYVCLQAYPVGAMCIQNFDDSRGFAIRTTYRILLRSSSMSEPRHPLLKLMTVHWYNWSCILPIPAKSRTRDHPETHPNKPFFQPNDCSLRKYLVRVDGSANASHATPQRRSKCKTISDKLTC